MNGRAKALPASPAGDRTTSTRNPVALGPIWMSKSRYLIASIGEVALLLFQLYSSNHQACARPTGGLANATGRSQALTRPCECPVRRRSDRNPAMVSSVKRSFHALRFQIGGDPIFQPDRRLVKQPYRHPVQGPDETGPGEARSQPLEQPPAVAQPLLVIGASMVHCCFPESLRRQVPGWHLPGDDFGHTLAHRLPGRKRLVDP